VQIPWQNGERVIPQIEFEFDWTEHLDQPLDLPRILLGHVTYRIRKVGLVLFLKIAKPLVQDLNWMDCHDDLPAFESADYLYLRK
jgi:hypothetical protein